MEVAGSAMGREYFDSIAVSFKDCYRTSASFRQREEIFVDAARRTLAELPNEPAPLCLDVGCGPGVLSAAMSRMGFRVVGVDSSRTMIDEARAATAGLPAAMADRCRFVQASALDFLRALDTQPDLILCSSVLEYVDDAPALVCALSKTLAPGGTLLASIPNHRSLLRRAEPLLHALFPKRLDYIDHSQPVEKEAIEEAARLEGLSPVASRHFAFPSVCAFALRWCSGWPLVGMLTLLEMKKNPGGSRSSFVRGGVSPAPGLVAAS